MISSTNLDSIFVFITSITVFFCMHNVFVFCFWLPYDGEITLMFMLAVGGRPTEDL